MSDASNTNTSAGPIVPVVDPKSILTSKVFWTNVVALIAVLAGAHKLVLTPDQQATMVGVILTVVNILLRLVTKGPVTIPGVQPAIAVFLAVGSLGLSACQSSTTPSPQVTAQVATDVQLIATGLQGALAPLGQATGMPPATVAKVSALVADVVTVAAGISASATQNAALPLIQQIENDVNGIVAALEALPAGTLPPKVSQALTAAQILLPVIEIGVNMVTPPPSPAAAAPARATLQAVSGS